MSENNKRVYAKLGRGRKGECNICTKKGPLTWDHVPPRGGITLGPMEIRSVFQALTGHPEDSGTIPSWDGISFRTICSKCNYLLGERYDPHINEFATSVGRYLHSSIALPKVVMHPTRPAALMRGVLGHLIAAKAEKDEVRFDKEAAACVLDLASPIPNDIHIYYWLFPYDHLVVLRDFAIFKIGLPPENYVFCQLLKFFPIAFVVTNGPWDCGLEDLTQHRNVGLGQDVRIPIHLGDVRPSNWPEAPDDETIILGGQSTRNSPTASRLS